ncbi:hypothetical protein AbraIFM66950_007670 [Aspergillus brasiliensis]|nr:hypothetical protein AbraIFM66950_007670 [Aspergillus brasiliensis]
MQSSDKGVLVIIGAGGMGLACARRVGYGRRIVLGDFSDAVRKETLTILKNEGHDVLEYMVNIADYNSVQSFAQNAARAGRLEAVVHTAGVSPVTSGPRQLYEIDLLGTAHVIEAFYEVLVPGTSMVCIGSIANHHPQPMSLELKRHLATAPRDQLLQHSELNLDAPASESHTAYSISKHGNLQRVRQMARPYGLKGARINLVSPGIIATPMGNQELGGPSHNLMMGLIDQSAMRRLGTPDDIANTVAFLTSRNSSYITGTDILVDGGTVAGQEWHLL